jgi:hypothetical protein
VEAAAVLALTTLVLLALAAYRATQLAVHDALLDPVRDRVLAWHTRRLDSPYRAAVVTLISCTYCAGWWLSGVLLLTWLLTTGQLDQAPLLVHGLEWFAVAGAQSLLNRWDDTRDRS